MNCETIINDKPIVPDRIPILSCEQLAQTVIDGGYPELQNKGLRS